MARRGVNCPTHLSGALMQVPRVAELNTNYPWSAQHGWKETEEHVLARARSGAGGIWEIPFISPPFQTKELSPAEPTGVQWGNRAQGAPRPCWRRAPAWGAQQIPQNMHDHILKVCRIYYK